MLISWQEDEKTNEQPTQIDRDLHDQISLHHIKQKLTIINTAPSNWNRETSSLKLNWVWDYETMVGEITWSPGSNWLLETNARRSIGDATWDKEEENVHRVS